MNEVIHINHFENHINRLCDIAHFFRIRYDKKQGLTN